MNCPWENKDYLSIYLDDTHTTPHRPLENEIRVIDHNPCCRTCKAKETTSVRPHHNITTGIAANESLNHENNLKFCNNAQAFSAFSALKFIISSTRR